MTGPGEKSISPATNTTGKAEGSAAPMSSVYVVPETALLMPHCTLPISSRALPRQREILVSMPVSLLPHLAVSCACFILSTSMVLVPMMDSTAERNHPQKPVAPHSFYPRANAGQDWQRNMSKATERVVRGRIVSLQNPIPIYCLGMKVSVTAVLYTSSWTPQVFISALAETK